MSTPRIAVIVEEPHWRQEGRALVVDVRRAARLALAKLPQPASSGLTVLLADDARLEALNRQFRGKPKATNVLAFPSAGEAYLGDVAIAYGVTVREARAAGKSIHDHTLHLAVHGVLHLLGYDHETAREARIMEPLEAAILAELGIADPYAARPKIALAN
jgi:probable rRNA maturation factor